jgi:hypothetical protein
MHTALTATNNNSVASLAVTTTTNYTPLNTVTILFTVPTRYAHLLGKECVYDICLKKSNKIITTRGQIISHLKEEYVVIAK